MKIKVYTGDTDNEYNQSKELTPVKNVQKAIYLLNNYILFKYPELQIYSNSPDFCSAIYYISKLEKYKDIEVEFYLNNELTDLEGVFKEFNKALDLINNIYNYE